MILYTIYDPSMIYQNIDYYDQSNIGSGLTEMMVNGVKVLASRSVDNSMRIERILSTNPYHYLDPNLQPGVIIKDK